MVEVFRSPESSPSKPPKNILRAILFHLVGPTGRPLTCAAFEVESGLELRLSYGDDVMRWQLFRGIDRDQRLAQTADAWHLAMIQQGFVEQPL